MILVGVPPNRMATNVQFDVHSKRFALRIATMIDARLIWYKHYHGWAARLIAELDDPPTWILEISTIKYYADAVAAVNRFAYCESVESFDHEQRADEHVACIFLRYQSGAISWATFLSEAGAFADGFGGRHDCEYFYALLNELEDNEYAQEVETHQRTEIECTFSVALSTIRPLYEMFMEYFREYVATQA
ncbi:MAG: hypothetical protein GXP27_08255 [Planctomycetes bacterium]|nr:hypothetical protein [Planctomycetota bacterium]